MGQARAASVLARAGKITEAKAIYAKWLQIYSCYVAGHVMAGKFTRKSNLGLEFDVSR